jgi:type II secretory pathway pseudopilin PulG
MVNFTRKGFTFIQIVVAIFILGVALSPVLILNLQSNKNLQENIYYLDAMLTATTIMSQAKQKNFLVRLPNEITIEKDNNYGFIFPNDLINKTDSLIILKYIKSGNNFVKINLELSYKNISGRETNIFLDSGVFLNVY